ncbi:hypothetical protein RI129_009411 [Pyrocoelia pectoralis]|uniref:Uncharacterized protein n=1 Tax=Pyrocoelia pectoralis TaxID=417401 RepID=A0AAN7VCH4_9COLE
MVLVTICAWFVLASVVSGGSDSSPSPPPQVTDLVQEFSYKVIPWNMGFPCSSTKNIYLQTGRFIQKNVISTGLVIYKDQCVIIMPRLREGVPITLGTFSLSSKESKPTILPYPCWSLQEEGNPEALQNVVDIVIDRTDTIWVLDTGICNTLQQPIKRAPPKIVGINAKTTQVVKTIDLSKFITPESLLQCILVDIDERGNYFAYISDAGCGALIVYDIFNNQGYRVVLPKSIVSESPNKDILYTLLIRKHSGNLVYFKYLNSKRIFYIKTSYLQKGQVSGAVVDVGPTPLCENMVPLGTDNGAAIFFRCKGGSDIYIWNTQTCLKEDNFLLVQKGDECRLATQVVPGYKRLMWVMESNIHDYVSNKAGCLGASVLVHPLIKSVE